MITVIGIKITRRKIDEDSGKCVDTNILVQEWDNQSRNFENKKELKRFRTKLRSLCIYKCGYDVDVKFKYLRLDYTPPYGLVAEHAKENGIMALNSKNELVKYEYKDNKFTPRKV